MQDIKRIAFSLLIIVGSALLSNFITLYLHGDVVDTIVTILIVMALFLFGVSLNQGRKKKSKAVFRKVFAIVAMLIVVFMELGYFMLPYLEPYAQYFKLDAFYMVMFYIFCGYLFVD